MRKPATAHCGEICPWTQFKHGEKDMKILRGSLIALGGALFGVAATAHEPAASRYRVDELPVPDSLRAGCLDDYAAGGAVQRINDFGVVNANFTCYTQVDSANATLQARNAAFVTAPWSGAIELQRPPDPGFSFGSLIDDRGEIFGYETVEGGFTGTRWTLFGGHELLFFDPSCNSIQVSGAADGNGRYIVGWGLRGDSRLPPPLDTLCLRSTWLIHAPDGTETSGPTDGVPAAINAFSVAVGTSARSAISYQVSTGQVRVLHAADATHSADAFDVNDLGEVAGRISRNSNSSTPAQCAPGVAARWDRDGSERVLPDLPGAVASQAFGIGYHDEAVGESGDGTYCQFSDSRGERAALWVGNRAFDLNTLIPPSTGITLTYAISVNRRGQISAGGFANRESMTRCPSSQFDPATGQSVITTVPCHNRHMYLLTPVGR
jgi:hypothetical protein